jgi:transposase
VEICVAEKQKAFFAERGRKIVRLRKQGMPISQLAARFGVTYWAIRDVLKRYGTEAQSKQEESSSLASRSPPKLQLADAAISEEKKQHNGEHNRLAQLRRTLADRIGATEAGHLQSLQKATEARNVATK